MLYFLGNGPGDLNITNVILLSKLHSPFFPVPTLGYLPQFPSCNTLHLMTLSALDLCLIHVPFYCSRSRHYFLFHILNHRNAKSSECYMACCFVRFTLLKAVYYHMPTSNMFQVTTIALVKVRMAPFWLCPLTTPDYSRIASAMISL